MCYFSYGDLLANKNMCFSFLQFRKLGRMVPIQEMHTRFRKGTNDYVNQRSMHTQVNIQTLLGLFTLRCFVKISLICMLFCYAKYQKFEILMSLEEVCWRTYKGPLYGVEPYVPLSQRGVHHVNTREHLPVDLLLRRAHTR